MNEDTPMSRGFGATTGSDLPSSSTGNTGSTGTTGDTGAKKNINIPPEVEQFLSRFGINEEALNNLKGMIQDVDFEQHLNTAREYLRDTSEKAKSYTKENPAKVAAGVAVLAIGAGLLMSALNKDKR